MTTDPVYLWNGNVGPTVRVVLPPAFYYDRLSRGLPCGERVKETKSSVTLDLDRLSLDDYRSDADYYVTQFKAGAFCDPGMIGLASSARASLRKLDGLVIA